MSVEEFLPRLRGVRRVGKGWIALCPAHDDRNPSLSIADHGGKILLHCFAGCSYDAVCAAAGITPSEFGVHAEYNYVDEKGALLFQVVRFEPKGFAQRRPDGIGGWIWKTSDVRRVLYNLPSVRAADFVLVCEGEKDCHNAAGLGIVATCNTGGAGKWREEYSETLRGKHVAIIADADEPGRIHGQQAAQSLFGKAASVKLLELPGAKDLTEWIEKGGTREQLESLILAEKEWAPGREPGATRRIVLVPADGFLARTSNDERPWLAEGLLPAQSQTIWQGRPKVGKSHSLLQLAFDLACGRPAFSHFAVARPIRVAYVELEEPEAITKARFGAMLRANSGNGPDAEHLSFLTRQDLWGLKLLPRELSSSHLQSFIAALLDKKVELLILVALRSLLSGKPGDPEVAERLNDALDVLAHETETALVLAHHSRKEAAETAEAQGFGSTMFSARADATFDMGRAADGYRRIRVESRFPVSEMFFLRKEAVGDGDLIRWSEPPVESKRGDRDALVERVGDGESVHKASTELGVPYSTAKRWAAEAVASP
jgi:5S rRNA maturation endonuclease (ribonuclease M5)